MEEKIKNVKEYIEKVLEYQDNYKNGDEDNEDNKNVTFFIEDNLGPMEIKMVRILV